MSIRAFTLVAVAALVSLPLSFFLWGAAGPWISLPGPGLLVLVLLYLAWISGGTPTTRWQVRYHLPPENAAAFSGESTALERAERFEAIMRYVADRAGHVAIEANAGGLFLIAPRALDQYLSVQIPRVLPEGKVTRVEEDRVDNNNNGGRRRYLCSGPLTSEALSWAMQDTHRQVRLHVHRGLYLTLTARCAPPPPGRWLRVPLPHPLAGLWRNLPLWDELSAGVRVCDLLPPTEAGAAHSSRSRLFQLVPPPDYKADEKGRRLGRTMDGRSLAQDYALPLFTTAAPAGFLVQQVVQDLARGPVVVLSPRRHTLERMGREAQYPTYWIDQEDSLKATHLAIATAAEWPDLDVGTVVAVTLDFLAGVGLDLGLAANRKVAGLLVHVLATSAALTDHDFTFVDLYAVSQSVQALRAFLRQLQEHFGPKDGLDEYVTELSTLLDGDAGYVQAVTALSRIRTGLDALKAGPLHNLSRPPFLDLGAALKANSLLLAPLANRDFPRFNRLLAAMLDLLLNRVLAGGAATSLALHLHDPHLYYPDHGRHWIATAGEDERLSLVLDVQDNEHDTRLKAGLETTPGGELVFRCNGSPARSYVRDWELPCNAAELNELPDGVALARLPGLLAAVRTVAVRTGEQ